MLILQRTILVDHRIGLACLALTEFDDDTNSGKYGPGSVPYSAPHPAATA